MLSFHLKRAGMVVTALASLSAPALAQSTEYDDKSAVIFAYFAIGNDDNPSASVTSEQFTQQIEEISSGGYTVKPLPEIIDAFAKGKKLPDKTIAITFDGADKSVLEIAAPLLKKNKLPFTVFVPTDRVSQGKPPFMSWDDLRNLKDTDLATFGLHPSAYARLSGSSETEIRRQINNSIIALRDELDIKPVMAAYPFGEYDEKYKSVLKSMGIKAAFGQQSGVAYGAGDLYALPRFTLTERYGDMERFIMSANALPLPVRDIFPLDARLASLNPAIGFTVPDGLKKNLKSISCFSSADEKPDLQIIDNRVELRLPRPFEINRPRINCTLPVTVSNGEDQRWRWFGMLYTVPPTLLEQAEVPTTETDFTSSVE